MTVLIKSQAKYILQILFCLFCVLRIVHRSYLESCRQVRAFRRFIMGKEIDYLAMPQNNYSKNTRKFKKNQFKARMRTDKKVNLFLNLSFLFNYFRCFIITCTKVSLFPRKEYLNMIMNHEFLRTYVLPKLNSQLYLILCDNLK